MRKIHLNCDLGEGLNKEAQLIPYISACNIACGAHAGSSEIIAKTIDLAIEHKVQIGAHPSYPDRENFGRKVLQIDEDELHKSLVNQMLLIDEIAGNKGASIQHVKAHGALYNQAAKDKNTAEIVLVSIEKSLPEATIFVPPFSVLATLASKMGLKVYYEVFCDRNYNEDYSLVNRSECNAVIQNPKEVLSHVNHFLDGKLATINGKLLPIHGDTFCVHGDTDNAFDILKTLNAHFHVQKL